MRRRQAPIRISTGLAFAGIVASVLATGPLLGQTPAASRHFEGAATAPIVESTEAMKVTNTIQCWCGGCTNQTLHECTCPLAAGERAKVNEALAAGQTPDALIAAYVAEHGPQVRIVPEKRGLDLIGWAIPFAASMGALMTLILVLAAWKRRGLEAAPAPARAHRGTSSPVESAYRERLERDLKELE